MYSEKLRQGIVQGGRYTSLVNIYECTLDSSGMLRYKYFSPNILASSTLLALRNDGIHFNPFQKPASLPIYIYVISYLKLHGLSSN